MEACAERAGALLLAYRRLSNRIKRSVGKSIEWKMKILRNVGRFPVSRTLFTLTAVAILAGCDTIPNTQSNTATPTQKQALAAEIVKFGIEGDVSNSSSIAQTFNVTFTIKDRYQALIGGDSTEWYRVFQKQRSFTPGSTYTLRFHKGKLSDASLDLNVNGAYCLTPNDVQEAIPAHYRGQGKLAGIVGIFEPTGEKLKNSTMFSFTPDNSCLKSVSFWSRT